jgi:hypothetical protein
MCAVARRFFAVRKTCFAGHAQPIESTEGDFAGPRVQKTDFLRYNVPARRAFCPCARLLRFNSETNLVQRQFAFLHFPKAWWEASGWPQLSQGVAR